MKNISLSLFLFSLVICLSARQTNAQCSTSWSYSNYRSCSYSYTPQQFCRSYPGYSITGGCHSYSPVILSVPSMPSNSSNVIPAQQVNRQASATIAEPIQKPLIQSFPTSNIFWNDQRSPGCSGGNCAYR